jgi:hypothetical protein
MRARISPVFLQLILPRSVAYVLQRKIYKSNTVILWWIHPTFRNRGTAYNSRSFAGNLLFVGGYGAALMLKHDHFYSFKHHADVEPCKFLVSLPGSFFDF